MSSPELPPELWLEVLIHLPADSLRQSSLVSRTFADLSRELRFATFQLHPYVLDDNDYSSLQPTLLPPAEIIDGALARLEFWTSRVVAPHIRRCVVSPWLLSLIDEPGWECAPTETPYTVLEAFLPRLQGLMGLQSLHMEGLYLEWTHLAALPALQTLKVEDVTLPDTLPENLKQTLTVGAFYLSDIHLSNRSCVGAWMRLLNPALLRSLSLICPMPGLDATYPLVTTLFLQWHSFLRMSELLRLLCRFPALLRLHLQTVRFVQDSESQSFDLALPTLSRLAISGPCELLPAFLSDAACPQLTHVEVNNSTVERFLVGMTPQRNFQATIVTSLTLNLSYVLYMREISYTRLSTILDPFPALTVADMCFNCTILDDGPIYANPLPFKFFESLGTSSAALPRALARLAVRWWLPYDGDWTTPDDCDSGSGAGSESESESTSLRPLVQHGATESAMRRVCEALRTPCSALRDVYADAYNLFGYRWQVFSGAGIIREEFISNSDVLWYDSLQLLREKWAAEWGIPSSEA
ncbi:L-aminoadipate-semialdehyde dehydrogenase [Mycena indigotica]|uniref:L-aminoadipate-semialdehyde dehydrogenase n=1 Tax=Mycena indigotica TaxID=2126181 RepID=A0A8H6SDM2_9AGAR|nr:L-aminoadipate-semialdehyde dehydrogenase [Mycena indigotica]KAF7296801.1 L-aminoadipate-semialdehyde dehydrogenase [Mycena indigotica]